ncbi:gamma-glutamyltransferase family protein [Paracoccus sp. S-4012]|uniref:gamma-glutamyltransferase family protein n=1 Tax=Paracoccus sp. S-4012 TaxID=2665648 RepID=UPI00351B1A2F
MTSPTRDFHLPGRSAVFARNGACATSHPLAAKVALDILARGGNAMDAAIAGAVLLGVCEPHMCGIGGDCFVLASREGEAEVIGLNGSRRAPAAADAARLRERGIEAVPLHAAEAVTIPTAIDGFLRLLGDHGRIGVDAVLAPSIRYFDEGVPVAPRVAHDWPTYAKALHPAARGHFLPGGRAPRVGEIFALPGQAEVLRRIARDGRDGFYAGEVAEDMLAALSDAGGVHTADDLAAAAGEYCAPISTDYRGTELIELPPNGQGAAALLMLNILSHFHLAAMDPFGAERVHLEAEAAKLAYDARNRFIAEGGGRLDHMLNPATAEALAALIDPARPMADPAPLTEAIHRDTIYITVVDRDRMAVSLIYSLFHPFGSGIASPRFGIMLQNRGAGFSLAEGHPNEMAPGRRPLHTIIPGMLRREGRVVMPFGVMGGAYQAAGHARFVSNFVDYGMDLQAAIDAPRSFPEAGALRLERGYGDAVAAELAAMGHRIERPEGPIGGAQAIWIRGDGVLEAASDGRKDGCALGC